MVEKDTKLCVSRGKNQSASQQIHEAEENPPQASNPSEKGEPTPKQQIVDPFISARVRKLNKISIPLVDRPSAHKRPVVERERVGVGVVVVFLSANSCPN